MVLVLRPPSVCKPCVGPSRLPHRAMRRADTHLSACVTRTRRVRRVETWNLRSLPQCLRLHSDITLTLITCWFTPLAQAWQLGIPYVSHGRCPREEILLSWGLRYTQSLRKRPYAHVRAHVRSLWSWAVLLGELAELRQYHYRQEEGKTKWIRAGPDARTSRGGLWAS